MAQVSVPQQPQRMVDFALQYVERGIPVFPLIPRDKTPVIAKTEGGEGFKDATLDPEIIQKWWRRWPRANIGIPTGDAFTREDGKTRPACNWCVVDIDTKHGATYDQLAVMGKLPPTMTAQTPSGGLHLIFRYPRNGIRIESGQNVLLPGIDIRAYGGYIAAAPSVTANGQYEWTNELEPAPLPSWLLKKLTEKPEPLSIRKLPVVVDASADDRDAYWLEWATAQAQPGTSDAMGHKLAMQLLLDPGVRDIDGTLQRYAALASFDDRDPFDDRDIDRWLKSAQQSNIVRRGEPAKNPRPKAQTARPLPAKQERPKLRAMPPIAEQEDETTEEEQPAERRTFHRTELGNAERLLAAYGEQLRYTKATGYVAWDGKRWHPGAELVVEHWAKAVIRDMYREAADLASNAAQSSSDGEREQIAGEAQELMKWAISSEKAKMVSAMLMLARSSCAVDINQFDREPWLFNCQNGTLDLRTGQLREHSRGDYLMQISPVAYDPHATCPTFLRFLEEIMLGDMEMVAYLQRVLGYSLTGLVSEQNWWLLLGDGGNGKGTLMEAFSAMLGEYAGMMQPESITMTGQPRKGSEASPDMAALKGKRFVRITETQEGARIDAARIKMLSGGDTISARFLHKDMFEFRPTFKIFIYTNHKPESRETTHAFWRRVRYIPFDFKPKVKPDEDLLNKLLAELPGILTWAVRGCLAWQHDGLNPPQRVLEATEAYRAESDVLGDFLSTYCVLGSLYEVRASVLYDKYVKWCNETGEHQQNMRRFGKALTERGVQRRTNNGIIYVGIGIRNDDAMF